MLIQILVQFDEQQFCTVSLEEKWNPQSKVSDKEYNFKSSEQIFGYVFLIDILTRNKH